MNVPFIRQWIAALRSGEYYQVRGYHKNDENGFCAVGLGYELCPGRQWVPFTGRSYWCAAGGWVVPPLLMKESGLDKEQLSEISWQLNDKGVSFLAIADHLEAMLPKETFAQDLYERLKDQLVLEEVA